MEGNFGTTAAAAVATPENGATVDGHSEAMSISDTGYDASSEETTPIRSPPDARVPRRRSRSWRRRVQQMERAERQRVLHAGHHGQQWKRRRLCEWVKKTRSANASPLRQQIKPNANDPSKVPDNRQQRTRSATPVRSAESEEKQQQAGTDADSSEPWQVPIKKEDAPASGGADGGGKLKFQVQLAHGSPTGIIGNFKSIAQLYQAIANCYDEITVDDILFCTLNTHRISMNHLLSCSISTNDFIFAHVAGQKKQVTMVKSEPALGLIITDNGVGKAFIKRIAAGTVTAKANPAIEVGDYIESINDESMVGRRHFDVARYLRTLPVGTTFTLRLVAPKRSGFNFISTYNKPNKALSASNANQTIRFKADGTIIVQEAPNNLLISKMNDIFNSYLGFHDDELAHTVCELAATSENVNDFMNTLKTSELNSFSLPREIYFDIWGVVNDYRNGHLSKDANSSRSSSPGKLKLKKAREMNDFDMN